MDVFPAAWGTTNILEISPGDPVEHTEPRIQSDWSDLVFLNADGDLHHGRDGCILPDTVVIKLGDTPVALADVFSHAIDNEYCYDCEYFLIVRLRDVLDPALWSTLWWNHLSPGDVFYAWDKFHDREYSRTVDDDSIMSYGGDWTDLQHFIDHNHPRPEGPRHAGPASATSLLRAVRLRDATTVRALLAAGADPNAGEQAPWEALRSVSTDRDTSALSEAILADSADLVEALLAAGARRGALTPEHWSPLYFALMNRKHAVVPVLLRFGADPDEPFQGRTPRDIAPDLFTAHPKRHTTS